MIVLEAEQGSAEWQEARLGIPTASAFDRIITPSGKKSEQRGPYMAQLLAEWALGQPQDVLPDLYWVDRGKALEGEAQAFYELRTDLESRRVGFVWRDGAKLVGGSPDWLCRGADGSAGGAEVKCPAAGTHISYLLGGTVAKSYVPQVQGAMWVTGATWWDFLSYYPELPPVLVRVAADPEWQARLDTEIPAFLEEMLELRQRLDDLGVRPGQVMRVADAAPAAPTEHWQAPLDWEERTKIIDVGGVGVYHPENADQALTTMDACLAGRGPGDRAAMIERNRAAVELLLQNAGQTERERWAKMTGAKP